MQIQFDKIKNNTALDRLETLKEQAAASKNSFATLLDHKETDKEVKPKKKNTDDSDKNAPHSIFNLSNNKVNAKEGGDIDTAIQANTNATNKIAMAQLAEQICERIDLMQILDKTEISFELRYPPIFAGAQITITEHYQAQKEYNIQFNNLQVLSSDGRQLFEKRLHELRQQLELKNVVVHQIQTNLKEIRAFDSHLQQNQQQQSREQQDQPKDQQQQKKREQQEEAEVVFNLD